MPRKMRSLLIFGWIVSVVAAASAGIAAEPHSYCVTGAPLVPGAGDTATNAIIHAVCGDFDSDPCCTTSPVNPKRWDLACVQLAARYAEDNLGLGDVCGRYAWAQGPIPGTGQFYPRDFNIFAGGAEGIRDTEGPVGSGRGASFSYFNLNLKQKEPIALLAASGASIQQGTINGKVIYAGSLADAQVTYVSAPRPAAPTSPFPVDFSDAMAKLIGMSQAIKAYPGIPAVKQYSTLTMTGTDPEMNVFSISADQLTDTYSYVFHVPFTSTVFVNVAGFNPIIANAGFSTGVANNQILWNFPDAQSLTMNGIGLPGSILAPTAYAQLRNGSVSGTVVVDQAEPADVELYSSPFRIPSSIGTRALKVDPSWSMTGNVGDDQTATDLTNEAGFLDIPADTYSAEGASRSSPEHRIWYVFQPAAGETKTKPLAVFFNGGPGAATSAYLFSFNTSTWTLDPCKVGGPSCTVGGTKIVFNPSTWTQFANLLYIDAPATGFSYPMGGVNPGANPSIGIDLDRDAGIFDEVLMRFMLRHPQILSNRVMLVGESYGGTRATMMLEHLFDYGNITNPSSSYQDDQLARQESSFFSAVFGTPTPTLEQVASKFSAQVLIEPALVGKWQEDQPAQGTIDEFNSNANCLPDISVSNGSGGITTSACWSSAMSMPGMPGWDATCDLYDCDKPPGYSDGLAMMAATSLNSISVLDQMVGANVKNVEWMYSRSRVFVYGRVHGSVPDTPEMYSAFGSLGPLDHYFVVGNDDVQVPYPGASNWATAVRGTANAAYFINRLLGGVSTFITVARHDAIIWSPNIRYAIENVRNSPANQAAFSMVTRTSYDKNEDNPFIYPAGTSKSRHGRMEIDIIAQNSGIESFLYATMPGLYESGHSVTERAPAELLADVMDWYARSQP